MIPDPEYLERHKPGYAAAATRSSAACAVGHHGCCNGYTCRCHEGQHGPSMGLRILAAVLPEMVEEVEPDAE